MLLPTYDVFDEERYFTSGIEPKVSTLPVGKNILKVGLQICEDLWDNNYNCKVSTMQKELGADIFINISASPFHKDRLVKRRSIIEEKVKSLNLPFLYCNMVGAQDELIFDGGSFFMNKSGKIIYQEDFFCENEKILDFGSGYGLFTKEFDVLGFDIVAVEINQKALKELHKKKIKTYTKIILPIVFICNFIRPIKTFNCYKSTF